MHALPQISIELTREPTQQGYKINQEVLQLKEEEKYENLRFLCSPLQSFYLRFCFGNNEATWPRTLRLPMLNIADH